VSNCDDRRAALRRELLRELEASNGHAYPERAIINAMYAVASPAPTRAEIETELAWLEENDMAAAVSARLGGSKAWAITDAGRLALHA